MPSSSGSKFAVRLLLVLLGTIFLGEMAIMLLVDKLLHSGLPYWVAMAADAAGLTLICAPVLWKILFIPLRRAYCAMADTAQASAQALVDATMETAILAEADGTVLAINQVGAQRFKLTPGEMVGRNIYTFMSEEVARARKARTDAILHSGIPGHFEDQRDGMRFATSVYPVMDDQGKAQRFAVFAEDITERLQLQAIDTLLHESDRRVLRGERPDEMLHFICEEAVKIFGLKLAWVGKKESNGKVIIDACGGNCTYSDVLRHTGLRWDSTPEGHGLIGAALRTGQAQVMRVTESQFQPWRVEARVHGFQSVMAIPLIMRGEIYGAFVLYSDQPDGFDVPSTVQRLIEVAGRISVLLEMAVDQQKSLLLGAALTSAGNAVFIADREGRIIWVNPAFVHLSGYSAGEAIGQTPRLFSSSQHDTNYFQQLWQTILSGAVWSRETVNRHKNGQYYTVMQTVTPIRNAAGQISHFVSIHEDISAKKLAEEHIKHLAHFDILTDLPNRTLFYDRLHQSVALAKRDGRQLALLFVDLDRFKAINDTLGHAVGDQLLQEVARRLSTCVRESDTLARLAGDEFTIILPNVEGERDTRAVAEKILSILSMPYVLEGHEASCGASIGIAFYPGDADAADKLVNCADAAMYVAKTHGRNTWRHYQSLPVS